MTFNLSEKMVTYGKYPNLIQWFYQAEDVKQKIKDLRNELCEWDQRLLTKYRINTIIDKHMGEDLI